MDDQIVGNKIGLLELWPFVRRRLVISDNYVGQLKILNDGLGRKIIIYELRC